MLFIYIINMAFMSY